MNKIAGTNQASEVKRSSLNKSNIDVKLESIIRGCIDDPHGRTIDEAKAAIQAIIRTEKLKARIDELEQIPQLKWDNHNHCLDPHHRTDRLDELKHELEKL